MQAPFFLVLFQTYNRDEYPQEEPFGPLSPITTFKSFDEVIEKANNQVAGLAAYVCTSSIDLANKTSEGLETGMVAVNTPFISNAETPFDWAEVQQLAQISIYIKSY